MWAKAFLQYGGHSGQSSGGVSLARLLELNTTVMTNVSVFDQKTEMYPRILDGGHVGKHCGKRPGRVPTLLPRGR